jgi:hypothetical protein
MKLRHTQHSFRTWSDWHRSLPAYIIFYTTSFCDVRKCDPNEWTNDKQIEIALAKIHRSRGDLARVKTVNVVKNRWLPSLRSAAIILWFLNTEITRGHSWSLVVIRGHSWSFVVTRGHSWSLVCTFRQDHNKTSFVLTMTITDYRHH